MTTKEFSDNFTVLLNSHSEVLGNNSFTIALDEYEKSVFLTNAQEEIVLSLYRGTDYPKGSFEETEEIRRYLSSLLKTDVLEQSGDSNIKVSEHSTFYQLPSDVWFITYESAKLEDESLKPCKNGITVEVVPITQDSYHRVRNNPFKGANNNRVLRLDYNSDTVELISKYQISEYLIKYLVRPTPIVLINLPEELSVNGIREETQCVLHPTLHKTILERAVVMAIASKGIINNK